MHIRWWATVVGICGRPCLFSFFKYFLVRWDAGLRDSRGPKQWSVVKQLIK